MRKNGCPFSLRDWVVEILSPASTRANPTWVVIKGLTSMEHSYDADTEDGSSTESVFSEPYVTKRSATISVEGRPVVDSVLGTRDPGQSYLDYYASLGGCEADTAIRLTDPVGRQTIVDVQVTGHGTNATETENTCSWEFAQVGEAEEQPYVQVTGISVDQTKSVNVNDTAAISVTFTPTTASNKKFAVASSDPTKCRVVSVDGNTITVAGVSAGTATISVRSMNNSQTDDCTVTVSAGT